MLLCRKLLQTYVLSVMKLFKKSMVLFTNLTIVLTRLYIIAYSFKSTYYMYMCMCMCMLVFHVCTSYILSRDTKTCACGSLYMLSGT